MAGRLRTARVQDADARLMYGLVDTRRMTSEEPTTSDLVERIRGHFEAATTEGTGTPSCSPMSLEAVWDGTPTLGKRTLRGSEQRVRDLGGERWGDSYEAIGFEAERDRRPRRGHAYLLVSTRTRASRWCQRQNVRTRGALVYEWL